MVAHRYNEEIFLTFTIFSIFLIFCGLIAYYLFNLCEFWYKAIFIFFVIREEFIVCILLYVHYDVGSLKIRCKSGSSRFVINDK